MAFERRSARFASAILSAIVAILIPGCGDDVETVAGLRVPVPEGWSAETSSRGTRRISTLRPPSRTSLCRVIVVRDGRVFDEEDVTALLGDGRAAFHGRGPRDVQLEAALGPMEGFRVHEPTPDPSWNLLPTEGELTLEMYAASLDVLLVSALFAGWSSGPGADENRARCLRSIRKSTFE